MSHDIHHSECIAFMRGLPSNHVDAIVTDPPYELGFMGKSWDRSGIANSVEMWGEALRILKPGGHLLAFSGSRTYHRMTCAIEDAGFEVRDQIMWLYGSGFPKSMDVSKAIDKAAGAQREVMGTEIRYNEATGIVSAGRDERTLITRNITAPATDAAKQWHGWGTALKPAHEPICVARKPLIGTVAQNVLMHGTGAINVDACRVGTESVISHGNGAGGLQRWAKEHGARAYVKGLPHKPTPSVSVGRWPANVIHDGSEEVVGRFPHNKGANPNNVTRTYISNTDHLQDLGPRTPYHHNDGKGSAARFFYCAKASKIDRGDANNHPTVKPTDLMRYLCRLVTPPNGLVFDPFTGSGSTGKAAILEGFRFLGCDMTAEYVDIARARIEHALKTKPNKLF